MTSKDSGDTFHFSDQGTLDGPGPIGRLVRLAVGAACLWLVYELLFHANWRALRDPVLLWWALFAFALLPYVINIGFGVVWGKWPRYAAIALIGGAVGVGWIATGTVENVWTWNLIEWFMLYVYGHLGLSFVLAAILGTPGCEMRAIPQLIGRVFGKTVREHHCPGFIGRIDRWERQRGAGEP